MLAGSIMTGVCCTKPAIESSDPMTFNEHMEEKLKGSRRHQRNYIRKGQQLNSQSAPPSTSQHNTKLTSHRLSSKDLLHVRHLESVCMKSLVDRKSSCCRSNYSSTRRNRFRGLQERTSKQQQHVRETLTVHLARATRRISVACF